MRVVLLRPSVVVISPTRLRALVRERTTQPSPVLFGFGTGGTLLKHDMSALINETVEISDAGTLLAQAVAQLDSPNTQQKTTETRYLIVIPTV